MKQPSILSVGFVTRYGCDKQQILNLFKGNKTIEYAWDFDLPYDLKDEYRCINRCAEIGINSAMIAVSQSVLTAHEYNPNSVGVYCGTYFGGYIESQKKQCDAMVKLGPSGILPGMSIHSGYHLTADIIAIKYGLTGPNITNATGKLASALAVSNAFDDLVFDDIEYAIVTGTEYIAPVLREGLKLNGYSETSIFDDGACSLILGDIQSDNSLPRLKAVEIFSYTYEHTQVDNYLMKKIDCTLKKAEITRNEIGCILTTQGNVDKNMIPILNTLHFIFNNVEITDVNVLLGDTLGASTIMGVGVAALLSDIKNILVFTVDRYGYTCIAVIGNN